MGPSAVAQIDNRVHLRYTYVERVSNFVSIHLLFGTTIRNVVTNLYAPSDAILEIPAAYQRLKFCEIKFNATATYLLDWASTYYARIQCDLNSWNNVGPGAATIRIDGAPYTSVLAAKDKISLQNIPSIIDLSQFGVNVNYPANIGFYDIIVPGAHAVQACVTTEIICHG